MPDSQSACVIVAAGAGSRMGGIAKALLQLDGRSFLECITDSLRSANVTEIVVVIAEPHRTATSNEAARLHLQTVQNPQPELGMAGSVAKGFGFAMTHFSSRRCFLWPVDLPRVQSKTLQRLQHAKNVICVPVYRDRGGHPVLVDRSIWPELVACSDAAQGARTVFRKHGDKLRRIQVDDGGVAMDVDHPEDLARLQK